MRDKTALCIMMTWGSAALYAFAPLGAQGAPDKAPKAEVAAPAQMLKFEAAVLAKGSVYSDGKNHFLAVLPDERLNVRLYYGNGKRFYRVANEGGGMASGWDFQDPRFFNKTANPNFRGLDFRVFSSAEESKDKKSLSVRCGERTTPFSRVEDAAAQEMLRGATFEKSPRKWRPYALARDNTGFYYYVDRGYDEEDPDKPRNFRLFVGPKGAMKLQKMTNVVSDSEGDIFSTKTGDLRWIINKGESMWVAGSKTRPLVIVEPYKNLTMIYNELGIYTGEKFGNPCDDI